MPKAMPKSGKTGYVIVQLSWEYNDEYYYQPEGGGGNPEMIFLDETKAKDEWNRLEREAWKKTFGPNDYVGLSDYIQDFSDYGDRDELAEKLARILSLSTVDPEVKKLRDKRDKREAELQKQLSGTLKGKALEAAITQTLDEELPLSDSKEMDAENFLYSFRIPKNIADSDLDKIRKLFKGIEFHEIKEVPVEG